MRYRILFLLLIFLFPLLVYGQTINIDECPPGVCCNSGFSSRDSSVGSIWDAARYILLFVVLSLFFQVLYHCFPRNKVFVWLFFLAVIPTLFFVFLTFGYSLTDIWYSVPYYSVPPTYLLYLVIAVYGFFFYSLFFFSRSRNIFSVIFLICILIGVLYFPFWMEDFLSQEPKISIGDCEPRYTLKSLWKW